MSHFEQRLEADLLAIRDWVWKMGDDVELALRNSKKALLARDEKLAYATVLGDHAINRDSRACDRLCHTFIARHLPGAGHLREMAATIRVNVALERIGDYAVTISRESIQLDRDLPDSLAIQIDMLADESFQILHESRTAFRDGNADLAKALMQMAKRVQDKMSPLYDHLFAAENGLSSNSLLAIFVVFNMLKRVADQAKNICDQTFYAIRGVAKIPKIHHILFLDRRGSDRAQLAVAIGRKYFPSVVFSAATSGVAQPVSAALQEFLAETGLPAEQLETEDLASLQHDLSEFDLMISLAGRVRDYVDKVPFHTSALEWPPGADDQAPGYSAMYRALHAEMSSLIDLLVGEEAG
jgi:phosphate transport system protein